MSSFLILKDAVKYSGKSDSTLKRLIREITADPNHEDRHLIDPDHDALQTKKEAGEPYIWKIHTDLLDKRYKVEEETSSEATPIAEKSPEATNSTVLSLLREQLEAKDRQIETLEKQLDRKDEQISSQNERMREQNILMKDLQQRLAIAAPSQQADVVSANTEQGSKNTTTNAKKRKDSIWTREFSLFRRRDS